MITELGLCFLIFSVIFSSALFFHQIFLININKYKNYALSFLPEKLSTLIFISTLFSFICLTYSFIISDFSLKITSDNSNSQLPIIYKITGVWGNHEGSILLWLLVMTFFGYLFSKNNVKNKDLKNDILCIQGILCLLIGIFILLTSNPFTRIFPPSVEGRDLNPLLQDPGLAIHPPFLYLGYVGFSIVYSIAIGILLKKKISKEFIIIMKPWVYFSWVFLTCGIGLGSWWAYYELGWGGFWFWDPVENASLLPWLTGTALLHSIIVSEKTGKLVSWTLLLAIITFSLSLLGTFLVRSGVLVSVHAFANDPTRGVFILFLLTIIVGFGVHAFLRNFSSFTNTEFIEPISKEGSISLNNIFMLTIAGTIFFGTIYPLISDLFFDKKISVGAPFFNSVLIPFMFPLVFGMIIGPFLKWKKDDLAKIFKKLKVLLLIIFISTLVFWYYQYGGPIISIVFITLSIWLGVSSLFEILDQLKKNYFLKKKLLALPSNLLSQTFAHFGIALLILGATGASVLKKEKIQFQQIGEKINIDKFTVEFMGVETKKIANYKSVFSSFNLYKNDRFIKTLHPEKRFYNAGNQVTTEAAIHSTLLGDIYIAIGDKNQNTKDLQSWTTRIWFNPFVIWIWTGILFMALGGCIALIKNFKGKR